jgi:hypothetical protein
MKLVFVNKKENTANDCCVSLRGLLGALLAQVLAPSVSAGAELVTKTAASLRLA